MMLRTVWSANPVCAAADPREVPAMGLAAQEATQPSPRPKRAADGEALLLAAGSSAARPRSRAAAARPAARRRMGTRVDDHDVMIYRLSPLCPAEYPKELSETYTRPRQVSRYPVSGLAAGQRPGRPGSGAGVTAAK